MEVCTNTFFDGVIFYFILKENYILLKLFSYTFYFIKKQMVLKYSNHYYPISSILLFS